MGVLRDVFAAAGRVYSAAADALSGRAYRRTTTDKQRVTPAGVSPSAIEAALADCSRGDLRSIADIYDLMPASDPIIRGVRRQLKAGVTSVGSDIQPIDDSAEAERVARAVEDAWERPEVSSAKLIENIIECELRGTGLVEILWNDPTEMPRRWTGFTFVPMQRLRFDQATGALRLVVEPGVNAQGEPITTFPAGKFLVIKTDDDVPDFSSRGVYRSILTEWYGRLMVRSWELQSIERFGMPIPVGKFRNDTDRQILESAFQNMGAAGSLVVSSGTEVEFGGAGSGLATGSRGNLVHEVYLERSAQRIAIAFLGSEQTVSVGDSGSRASAQVHSLVRKDVLWATWGLVSAVVRRDLFVPFVRMNFGEAMVKYTPLLVPQFDEPLDFQSTAQALEILQRIRFPVPLDWAREALGVPKVEPGEDLLPEPTFMVSDFPSDPRLDPGNDKVPDEPRAGIDKNGIKRPDSRGRPKRMPLPDRVPERFRRAG